MAFALWNGVTLAAGPVSEAQSADKLVELPLEQLLDVQVYAASKFLQKASDAPSAVTVITASEIEAYGYRSLADVLKSIRGLYVSNDRNYSYLGVRGFSRPGDYNTRVLLLLDGYRINDNVFDQAVIGYEFPIDVDLIDRVEFIPGPGSSMYGSNAFLGVINVVTKHGHDYAATEIKGEVASAETVSGRATYGRQWGGDHELLLSASGLNSEGRDLFFPEFNSPATNNGVAQGLDYERAQFFLGKFSASGLSFGVLHHERTKGIPTGSFGQLFNDPRSQTVDGRNSLSLAYDTAWSSTELSARASYTDWHYRGDYVLDYPPVTVNQDRVRGRWWDGEIKLTSSPLNGHRLVTGVEYQQDLEQTQMNFDDSPRVVYLDNHHHDYRYGVYAQDEISVAQKLLFNAGLRYDYYSTGLDSVNPRLAAIFKPRDTTSLKLLYGTAFRAPNAYELYYGTTTTSGFKTNPNLEPETIATYEFVAEERLPGGFRLTGSAFHYDIRNLISLTTDPVDGLLVFINLEHVRVNGIEFEAEKIWASEAKLRASLTWQRAVDSEGSETAERMTNSPSLLAKLNFMTPLWRDFFQLGLESQYVSNRRTLRGENTGAYAIFNATLLTRKLAPGLVVSASVYNLFDKAYADPASEEHVQNVIVQDGRIYRLSASYRF
ncbi:MAG: TonB-dependent receptor [Betaproteobacteria bacterium]|nr:TonB-dependent receptor [Betaproteobacteria bacterium]